jgi:hypothetical protein
MIRDNHDWASGGNPGLVGGIDAKIDSHLEEQVIETESFWRALHAPIQIPHLSDWCQLSGEAGKLRDAR